MKAGQLTGPRRYEIIETDEPKIQNGQVMVKVEKLSICGSDIRPFSRVYPEEVYPMPIGRPTHEVAGVIEDSMVQGFNPGERVIVFPYDQGGFRERITVTPECLVKLPTTGSLDTWILCQPMGTVLYAVSRMGDVIDKNVIILGQGAIGLSFTRFLSGMNCRELIVVDMEDNRLALGKSLGATIAINPKTDNVESILQEVTQGIGPDIVVEAAGVHETVQQSVKLAKKFGTVIWMGMTHDEFFPIDFEQVRNKDLTMIGTSSARAGTMPRYVTQVVHMVNQGRLDPDFLLTHKMDSSEIQKALEIYENRQDGMIKVVLDMQ